MNKVFLIAFFFLGLLCAVWATSLQAANEVQDAYTGTNPKREYTETDSLFNVLRNVYRPDTGKPKSSVPQTPYQRIPPPKWSYYGSAPTKKMKEEKESSAIDGRYYKPPASPKPENSKIEKKSR